MQAEYMFFHIHFRQQAAIFNLPPTLTLSCTNIRPTMLFNVKNMRIPLKFHIYSICNVRFKCFRFHVRHFDLCLNSHRIVHMAMLLSAAETSVSSQTNATTLNLLPKVICALSFNGHQVFHIFTQQSLSPSTFISGDVIRKRLVYFQLDYFENLNIISSCFDGSRNTPKRNGKFLRATVIFKKNEGSCNFAPPLFEGQPEVGTSIWSISIGSSYI